MLVVGLGNPLLGDEGVGCHVIRRLAETQALPPNVETVEGGTDLLRLADLFRGRRKVVLVDAVLAPEQECEPGRVTVFDREHFDLLEERSAGAHRLSAVEGVRLLEATSPRMRGVAFVIVAVEIGTACVGTELSEPVARTVPRAAEAVLALVGGD